MLMTRTKAVCWMSAVAAVLAGGGAMRVAALAEAQDSRAAGGTLAFVGTYTGAKTGSRGIYAFRMRAGEAARPVLDPLGLAAETDSPSFLVVDPARDLLFAVNETDQYQGQPTGSVSAYKIDRARGTLTLINRQPSSGKAPCHLTLDKERRHLLVANYSSGTVAVLPVAADGRLGPPKVVQHTGSSVNRQRQEASHAHCTNFDPGYRFFFVCDLGIDKVMAYRLDEATGTLAPHDPPFASSRAGDGPRHMDFRPDGRFAYVLNELTSTVTTFAYDAGRGVLSPQQTISALPSSHTGSNSAAEIAVHPSGRFLYSSNRGHDSIAVFSIDPSNGQLSFVEAHPTGGRTPRHFALDPSGNLLFAANQNSGSVHVFAVDTQSGHLSPTGATLDVPSPVSIVFLGPR